MRRPAVDFASGMAAPKTPDALAVCFDEWYSVYGEGHRLSPRTSTESKRRPRGGVALVGMIGGYVVLCILAGLGVGVVLDRLLSTGPLFLIAGVVVGFVLSFYLIYRLAMEELV